MSKNPNLQPTDGRGDRLGVENGLAALRQSPTFRGPVEPFEGHDSNDHLALIYETRAEQFGAAIPFVRQGLERGERCLYVADENSKEDVLDAMRDTGLDVDEALDSGALTLHTKQDTYHRNGEFDPDGMIAFLEESIEEATEGYEGLRSTAEMTWVLGEDPQMDRLIEYEGKLNRLYADADCIGLCQYNRERFSAEILSDVIRTHPHLIYDHTVSHNYHYTPPEEFFGGRPASEVDRMLGTLRERTRTTVQLRKRERQLKRQNDRLESFASMLAHELRNPLQIAQIYLQQVGDEDPDSVAEIERALDRMEEMIDVLLITARTTDAPVERDEVSLADAATDVWEEVSVPSAELVTETDRTVSVDSVHLWHLLKNLLENAVEHGSTFPRSQAHDDTAKDGDEGVIVRIGDLEDDGGFYVEDDGPGIPPEELDAAFEAGYTSESNRIGLGLTFVAQLAAVYDWDCSVTESADGGVRFEFRDGGDAPSLD